MARRAPKPGATVGALTTTRETMKRIALFAGGLLAAHVASAGVYVETVKHDIPSGATEPSQKIYVQNGSGRFVDPEGRSTLIKGDTMYIIDEGDRSYILLDKAAMSALAKKLGEMVAKAKEQMAKLPPEQRAQYEQMMGPAMMGDGQPRTVEVKDTGKSDKVEGRPCKVWDVTRDGQLDEQICVAAYSSLPGKENFQAVFANFAKVFEEMAKSVPMLAGMMNNEFSAQAKTNGYPMRQRAYDERGKLEDQETLVKVWREETIAASMFEIPAGYKQKPLAMGPGM
jgi:uncharacterized protein DUF4412